MRPNRHRGKPRTLAQPLTRERQHPTRLRRDQRLIRRILRIRPGRTKSRDRANHRRLVQRPNIRVLQPPSFRLRRRVRRDHHVRLADQRLQPIPLRHDIQLHRALAPKPHRSRRQRPPRIPANRLHLHHLSPKVGQHHRRDPANRPRRQVQHTSISQRWGHQDILSIGNYDAEYMRRPSPVLGSRGDPFSPRPRLRAGTSLFSSFPRRQEPRITQPKTGRRSVSVGSPQEPDS